jgi:hypothetical protein
MHTTRAHACTLAHHQKNTYRGALEVQPCCRVTVHVRWHKVVVWRVFNASPTYIKASDKRPQPPSITVRTISGYGVGHTTQAGPTQLASHC